MKRIYLITALIISAFICNSDLANAQGMAVNTTGAAADSSALLDVSSTAKGLLPPRMTTAQKNAIVRPANGLIVSQTDSVAGLYYNAGTPATPLWQLIGPKASPAYGYLYSTTQQYVSSSPEDMFFNTPGSNQINNMSSFGEGLQILAKGVYHITYSLTLQSLYFTSQSITATVYNYSTPETPSNTITIAPNTTISLSGELFLSLNAGDDIILQVNTSSGGATYINSCFLTAIQLQ